LAVSFARESPRGRMRGGVDRGLAVPNENHTHTLRVRRPRWGRSRRDSVSVRTLHAHRIPPLYRAARRIAAQLSRHVIASQTQRLVALQRECVVLLVLSVCVDRLEGP
jgi:hypothetical protein